MGEKLMRFKVGEGKKAINVIVTASDKKINTGRRQNAINRICNVVL